MAFLWTSAESGLNRLVEKSVKVKWGDSPETRYMVVGKKVLGKKKLIEEGYLVFELENLVEKQ